MKTKRQQKIIEIIKTKNILTQEELQDELLKLGFNVTQSTVSRDIKELKLVKGHDINGSYHYLTAPEKSSHELSHYRDIFAKSVKSADYALNNVVIKCFTGMASPACVALDKMFSDMMLGSLAGEDTIIIVTKCEQDSKTLLDELNKLI